MTEWNLFVDESGNFEEPGDHCVVAGLLVRSPLTSDALEDALRGAVTRAAPHVRYPPHASHLNTGFGWLAGIVRADDTRPGLSGHVTDVADRFPTARGAKLWRRVVADSNFEPSFEDLREMRSWLGRTDTKLLRAVGASELKQGRAFAHVVRDLPVIVQGDVFGLAAYCPPGTVVEPLGHGELARDRYTDALEALLERVLFLLRGPGCTNQRVLLHVATRHVVRGRTTRAALSPSDVGAIAAEMVRRPPSSEQGLGVRVQLRATATPRYDHRVHPGVVFADFFANRLRQVLKVADHRPLRAVAQLANEHCGLPVGMTSCAFPSQGRLSAIAVVGAPRRSLRDVVDGQTPAPVAERPPWVHAAYSQWIGAARKARTTQVPCAWSTRP